MRVEVWRRVCLLVAVTFFYGCQSTPQADAFDKSSLAELSQQHLIEEVPFYPQQDFYCGPTTLSEVFNYYKQDLSPDEIAPQLFIPGQQGSLQVEMMVASRENAFLPYTDYGTLSNIISLVADNIPVIVFQNVSISLFPQWHYAVVIGYDLSNREIILHTGLTPQHQMSFELFGRTWARGEYWMLAPLPVGKTSQQLNSYTYVSAAYDILSLGNETLGVGFLESAIKQWPDYWLPYFLIGNHYIETSPSDSVHWFSLGYDVGRYEAAYANNYSVALLKNQQFTKASKIIDDAILQFGQLSMLTATKVQIETAKLN